MCFCASLGHNDDRRAAWINVYLYGLLTVCKHVSFLAAGSTAHDYSASESVFWKSVDMVFGKPPGMRIAWLLFIVDGQAKEDARKETSALSH